MIKPGRRPGFIIYQKLFISDAKTGADATVYNQNDYTLFGPQMDGAVWNLDAGRYRYGFNGKENDNEVKGEGNQLDFGARVYDPRIGKFLSTDPFEKKFPDVSPYGFAGNDPISFLDYNGMFKISPFFAKRYPTLAKVIKYYLPMLKDNPTIREAWVKTSGYKDLEIGRKDFDEMVTYGEGPYVSPTRRNSEAHTTIQPVLQKVFGGEGGGEYDPKDFPDNLLIGYAQVEELEAAIKKGNEDVIAEAMFVVTNAIMHEASHYGRYNNGRQRDDDYFIEAGAQFEQFAYGTRFSYRNPSIADEKSQRRDMGILKETFHKIKGTPMTFGMSIIPNYYNYYKKVQNLPVPKGQAGDITVKKNNDIETP